MIDHVCLSLRQLARSDSDKFALAARGNKTIWSHLKWTISFFQPLPSFNFKHKSMVMKKVLKADRLIAKLDMSVKVQFYTTNCILPNYILPELIPGFLPNDFYYRQGFTTKINRLNELASPLPNSYMSFLCFVRRDVERGTYYPFHKET